MPFELDFLPVGAGNADAIGLRYWDNGRQVVQLIDGGYQGTTDTILTHLDAYYGSGCIVDRMVVTHTDNDHAAGLVGVMKDRYVGELYMNRPWDWVDRCRDHFHGNFSPEGLKKRIRDSHEHLVRLEELALKRDIPIYDAFQGDNIGPFRVLGPSLGRYINAIPDMDKTPNRIARVVQPRAAGLVEIAKGFEFEAWNYETLSSNPHPVSASNETSVVQYAVIDGFSILLTGDAGPVALNEAADYIQANGLYSKVYPNLIQVPHHGSRKNVTPEVLNRLIGGIVDPNASLNARAFCSVGSNKLDYPRRQVVNAFERRGYKVYVTRGKGLCQRRGFDPRPGWVSAVKEPWSDFVEA